jgi:hypothetical protein
MERTVDDAQRDDIVKNLNEVLKALNTPSSPVEAGKNDLVKARLLTVLAMFETGVERVKREQA